MRPRKHGAALIPDDLLVMNKADVQSKNLDLTKSRMSWEKLRPAYVKAYSETFSEEEIDGILAFYESLAGRAMQAKMPVFIQK